MVRIHLVLSPLLQPEHSLPVTRAEKLSKSLAVVVERVCQFSRQAKKLLPCPFLQQAQATPVVCLQSIRPFFHPLLLLVNQCQELLCRGRPCQELLCLQAVEDSVWTRCPEAMPSPQRLVETNLFQPQPQIREALSLPPPHLAATILSGRHHLLEELILFPLPRHRQAATILLEHPLLQAEPIPFPHLPLPVERQIRLGHLLRPVEQLIRSPRLLLQLPVERQIRLGHLRLRRLSKISYASGFAFIGQSPGRSDRVE